MVNIFVTLLLIVLFFFSGRIYESIKRLLVLSLDIVLKILNLFGIHINRKERRLITSIEFKRTFKDIRIVRKSKHNNKIKSSINLAALITLIISIALITYNIISGGAISNFLYNHNPFPSLIVDQSVIDITMTALIFSVISFSISKLISQWKETIEFRKANKEIKLRQKVLNSMSSKNLLDIIKQKDKENIDRLTKPTEE